MTADPLATDPRARSLIADARALLGVDRLALGIHDACFPGGPGEDPGRGSAYTRAAGEFLRAVAALGFDGVQLGPQGETSATNPSPYDGTVFSRSVLAIALEPLASDPAWCGVLEPGYVAALLAPAEGVRPDRCAYGRAHAATHEALARAHDAFARRRGDPALAGLAARFRDFRRAQAAWLDLDARYDALERAHGGADWSRWPDPDGGGVEVREADLERYAFAQFVAHAQHEALRARARALGVRLYADLQVGYSRRDLWAHRALFLEGYAMGAPPSRTNPDGQPWGYPVLDPARYRDAATGAEGPTARLVRARAEKALAEYDGVRVDHPHGLIDPWVYAADAPDPHASVRAGARLFSSPDLPDHPRLARFAIARAEQLDRAARRWDDGWVRALEPAQVARYATLFDVVVARASDAGRASRGDVVCEVLSTMPYPVGRVLERHGLGRFRVTQKADVANPRDVYRSENALPADWIMVGNHDTPPIWRVARRWVEQGDGAARARFLAERVAPDASARASMAERLARDPDALARAALADVLASPARHAMVWWADLVGVDEVYNAPGTVSDANWSLRLPPSWADDYRARRVAGAALDVPRALATALRARGACASDGARAGLARALDDLSAGRD